MPVQKARSSYDYVGGNPMLIGEPPEEVSIGGPVTVDPNSRYVLTFEGNTDGKVQHVSCGRFWPASADIDLGRFWWDGWAKPSNAGYLISAGYGGAHEILLSVGSAVSGNIQSSPSSISFGGNYVTQTDEWIYWTLTWDGTWLISWINGVPDGMNPFAGPRLTPGEGGGQRILYIGGSNHQNFSGSIAMVRCWDRNFTAGYPHDYAFRPIRYPILRDATDVPCDGFWSFDKPGAYVFDLSPKGVESLYYANPTTVPTVAVSGSGGTLGTGNYLVSYTWSNEYGETLPSGDSTSTALTSGQNLVVTIPTLPTGIVGANFYVSTTNGASNTKTRQNPYPVNKTTYTVGGLVSGNTPPTINKCSNGKQFHHGRLYGDSDLSTTSQDVDSIDGSQSSEIGPRWAVDDDCPYGQPIGSPSPVRTGLTPRIPPAGAIIYDSFQRQNTTLAFQQPAEITLGSTETTGGLTAHIWNYGMTGGYTNRYGTSGTFGILGGKAYPTTNGYAATWVNSGSSNHTIIIRRDIASYAFGEAYASFRVTDKDNMRTAGFTRNGVLQAYYLFRGKVISGTPSLIGATTLSGTNWSYLKIVASGSTITYYYDLGNTGIGGIWTEIVQETSVPDNLTGTGVGLANHAGVGQFSAAQRVLDFAAFTP